MTIRLLHAQLTLCIGSNPWYTIIKEDSIILEKIEDLHLIKYDIKASISHAKMLYKSNLLTEIECNKIIDIWIDPGTLGM